MNWPEPEVAPPRSRLVSWSLVVVYAALVFTLSRHHEPWRDEVDAWLMARDANLRELFEIMGTAGTPSLWYLVQMPFAKLGFPFATQALLNLAISVAAAAVIALRAPWHLATRALFLSGYFMSYEYSVIARSYALSVLLVFAAASLFRMRERHPLALGGVIALLANTNAHSFFIALGLVSGLLVDCVQRGLRGPVVRAGLLAALGIVLAFVQLLPPADAQMPDFFQVFGPGNLIRGVELAFVPPVARGWALLVGVPLLFAGVTSLVDRPRALAVTLISYLGLCYLYVFKYGGFVRHFGFLLIVLLLGLWLAMQEEPSRWWPERFRIAPGAAWLSLARRSTFLLLMLSLGLSTAFAMGTWRLELTRHSSEAFEMARYLREHGLEQRIIAAHPPGWTTAILADLPKRGFYYPALGETRTHMRWDRRYIEGAKLSNGEAVALLKQAFPRWNDPRTGILLVVSGPLPDAERLGYRLVHATPGELFDHLDERFFLYEPLHK